MAFPDARLALMDTYWTQITTASAGNPLAVEPLFSGACADEGCIGVRTVDDKCVCAPGGRTYQASRQNDASWKLKEAEH